MKTRKVNLEEIKNNNYSLDYCGFPKVEKVILSPLETIKNYQKSREDLEKTLDTQLNEILKLLEK